MTQNEAVLDELRFVGDIGLSPLEALNRLGVFRLSARIWDLRRDGHLIIATTEKISGKSWSRYRLIEQPEVRSTTDLPASGADRGSDERDYGRDPSGPVPAMTPIPGQTELFR